MRCVFVGCLCNTCLFKSTPVMSLLYVPCATPSGFSMGTSLNTNLCHVSHSVTCHTANAAACCSREGGGGGLLPLRRRSRAVVLEPNKKSIKPLLMQSVTRAGNGRMRHSPSRVTHPLATSYRIIQEALGSPGCTRAVMMATVFESKGVESAGG